MKNIKYIILVFFFICPITVLADAFSVSSFNELKNAILNYKGQIQDLEGSTVYVTVSPCTNCVLALSQVGIKNVIYLDAYHREEIHNAATYIMDKCGIN